MKKWDSVSLYLHKALDVSNKYDSTKQLEAVIIPFLHKSFLEQNKSDSQFSIISFYSKIIVQITLCLIA